MENPIILQLNPTPDIGDKKLTVDDYAKEVTGWDIYGYHPPLNINGVEYAAQNAFYSNGKHRDLLDSGNDGEVRSMQRLMSNINSSWQFGRDGFENPSVNMFVSVTDVGSKSKDLRVGQKLVQIGVFHDNRVSKSGRGGDDKSFSIIGLSMSTEIADKFEVQLRNEPDIVNDLMEKALCGVDATPEHVGLERYKATSLTFVSKAKLAEITSGEVVPSDKSQLPKFILNCQEIPFKNGSHGMKEYTK